MQRDEPQPRPTQAERRAETRRRLLDAARRLFAERGIDGVSVDAIADAAGRTSGALYDHFGSKEGLLLAVVDEWKDATGAAIASEFDQTETIDGRLAAVWRNFADPPVPGGEQWVLLEHELWLYAARNAEARTALAERYDDARRLLGDGLGASTPRDGVAGRSGDLRRDDVSALVVALVIGLEMQRRLDPKAVEDDVALAGLRAVCGLLERSETVG